RLLDDLDDVAVAPFGSDVVDAHAARLLPPVQIVERPSDFAARLDLHRGSNCVLEITKDMVGARLRALLQHLLAASWNRKLRAAPPSRPLSHRGLLMDRRRWPRACRSDPGFLRC